VAGSEVINAGVQAQHHNVECGQAMLCEEWKLRLNAMNLVTASSHVTVLASGWYVKICSDSW
jgi:hypothetical protein